jgi:hypothetical protein
MRFRALLPFLLLTQSCGFPNLTPVGAAHDTFAAAYFCPRERVTVVDHGREPPPAEVARDPERLKLWQESTVYYLLEARGCDRQESYRCRHGTGHPGDTGTAQYRCLPAIAAP